MISKETEAEILCLYHAEKWLIGTIAEQLAVHQGGSGTTARARSPAPHD